MEIPNEMIMAGGVATASACGVMFRWILKRLASLEKETAECRQDRVVLLKFATRAIHQLPELETELTRDLTQTQLIRLTKRPA